LKNYKLSLLLVDDEPQMLDLLKAIVNEEEFVVITAENGKKALEFLKQHEFDIIISDMNMPGNISGLDLLNFVKDKNLPTKFIMQTGYATVELAIEAMKKGAFDFLTKPVSLAHFTALLNKSRKAALTERENLILRTDNARLVELNKIKEKFIAITNHELRTPITILKGYLDLLETHIFQIENENAKKSFDTIKITMYDFESLIERMHMISQLQETKIKRNNLKFDLFSILEELELQLEPSFRKRKLNFSLSSGPGHFLKNDKFLIKLAISEVLQNSIRFTANGGKISIKTEQENEKISLFIEDSGIGINVKDKENIFELFYEGGDSFNHSTSRDGFLGSSMGIGLAIVKLISEACNFETDIKSVEGEGTRFSFSFSTNLE
jgi:signal transduction histidine kinase